MKIKQKIINYFEKKTRKKLLKKEMDKLKAMKTNLPNKNKNDKTDLEKQFNDSLIATKKLLGYCKQKGYSEKKDWEKAGIPMKDVVKDLLVSTINYSDVRIKDVQEIKNE